jgi:uncharacterized delta-60 repeat protein
MIARRKAFIVVAAFVLMAIGLPWGGNVPAAFAQIQVTSANPDTGDQGTLGLNVTIGGKGFKKGAKANFYLKGTTNPAGITVRATKFVSDASLVATIDIAAGATPDDFDIVVANADGRTGKGTELFAVLVKIDPCTQPDPVPAFSADTSYVPGFPGYLDANFGGTTGRVIGPKYLRVGYSGGRTLAVDSAGRTLAVGLRHDECVPSAPFEWGIARYLSNGSLDSSFGSDGLVTVGFAGTPGANAVALQPDGKVLVVGAANPSNSSSALPVVVRLNADGTVDGTFGTGGVAWVSPGGKSPSGSFNSVALQSNGKIVAAGFARASGLVSRLNANGTLDATFNGSGKYITPTPPCCSTLVDFNAVTTQFVEGEERIVVAGSARDDLNHRIGAVWRFRSTGAVDAAFGTSGEVRTSFHDSEDGQFSEEMFKDVLVDSSGRIVAAGYAGMSTPPDTTSQTGIALARFDVGGALDASFGVGGRVLAWAGQHAVGYALVIQSDGRIVVGGRSHNDDGTGDLAGLWRFSDGGAPDTVFGNNGWVAEPTGYKWSGIALQGGDTIVCGGYGYFSQGDRVFPYAVLARFWQ